MTSSAAELRGRPGTDLRPRHQLPGRRPWRPSDQMAEASTTVRSEKEFNLREVPVVIYSMATSSSAADERPDLIRMSCRTPQQMAPANALCRAWETRG
jgi:hypothetical protein